MQYCMPYAVVLYIQQIREIYSQGVWVLIQNIYTLYNYNVMQYCMPYAVVLYSRTDQRKYTVKGSRC